MSARTDIEAVMADIFQQYLNGSGFSVLAGRGDGVVSTPYFVVVAEEVVEVVRGSGMYLGDVSFDVVTSSNDELSPAQTTRITECMNFVRSLSNTLCDANTQIADTTLMIMVDGIVTKSEQNTLDTQSFGDKVEMRIGFRKVNTVPVLEPQTVNPLFPSNFPPPGS